MEKTGSKIEIIRTFKPTFGMISSFYIYSLKTIVDKKINSFFVYADDLILKKSTK